MKLGIAPVINASANVRDCQLGRYTQVGPRTSMIESTLGDYCHVVNDAEIIYTAIGKFCSIAVMVRINPGSHPMCRSSQSHFTYRAGHKVVQAHGLLWVMKDGSGPRRFSSSALDSCRCRHEQGT